VSAIGRLQGAPFAYGRFPHAEPPQLHPLAGGHGVHHQGQKPIDDSQYLWTRHANAFGQLINQILFGRSASSRLRPADLL
jgi:hypothetical protein